MASRPSCRSRRDRRHLFDRRSTVGSRCHREHRRRAGNAAAAAFPVDPKATEVQNFPGIRALWRFHLRPDALRRVLGWLPDLEWVHSDYVGVDDLPLDALAGRGLLLSNGAGISAGPMAEWVVLALLAGAKQLPRFVRQSDAGVWEGGPLLSELRGAVVMLLGLGAIGSRVAELLEPFGAEVRAWTRRSRNERPRGVTQMLTGNEWKSHLAETDFLVSTLPLTPITDHLIDAAVFDAMKPGAWVVNISRGGVVVEDDLIAALDSGKISGAILDVFSQEPLPMGHPLWGRPDVLVLPHITWSSSHTLDDFTSRFAAQLRRFIAGETPADLIDLSAGY
ncbi:MAG: D-2-hydroxyacid dehydrogenase [Acidimicrobiales bacterium]